MRIMARLRLKAEVSLEKGVRNDMGMGMGTATVPAAAKQGDPASRATRMERQNFIKSLASMIGPE